MRLSKKYEQKKGCGLIPIGNKVSKVQTQGFQYNFGNKGDSVDSLDFKENICCSNVVIDETKLRVMNSHPLLFCTSLNRSWF